MTLRKERQTRTAINAGLSTVMRGHSASKTRVNALMSRAIHAFRRAEGVDGRNKSGHDGPCFWLDRQSLALTENQESSPPLNSLRAQCR